MCGIAGFLSDTETQEKKTSIIPMMNSMAHRGPDDEMYYLDDKVALGFRRLAIIDLEGGRQPISNEDGSIWLVMNGEVYNFRKLREELKGKGHVFQSMADSEVIVHAYEEWDTECLQRLDGMFAFGLWDKTNKRLFMAVDRLGIKPLYYTESPLPFIFASEIKAIFASGLAQPEFDCGTLPYHMAFLWAPHPLTLFKNIKKLSPGHFLVYQKGHRVIKKYWDIRIEEYENTTEAFWTEMIQYMLYKSVDSHLISDVPLGSFLSGGIDSSAICASMAEGSSSPINTYFIAFSDEDLNNDILMNEMPFADLMANRLCCNHKKIIVTPNMNDIVDKIVWHLEEPIGDPAAITTFLVSKAARETLTVLLSGVGGDEVFGGYPRYLAMKLLNLYKSAPKFLQAPVSKCIAQLPGGKNSLFRNLKKFHKASKTSDESAYFEMLCYFNKGQQSELFTSDFYKTVEDIDILFYHQKYYQESEGLDWLNRLQYLDFKTFLPCLNLMYTDKMSMAASIEVRVPFLDHHFVEKMLCIPSALKIKKTQRKYIFKKAMEGILPHEIIWRKKAGFGAPVHSWIRGKLRHVIEDYLSESRLKREGIFNPKYVRQILDMEYNNQEYYSNHIWQIFIFELWYEKFILHKKVC